MLSRSKGRVLFLTGLIVLAWLCPLTFTYAQSTKPLTLQDLVQMQKAGFDDQTVANAIAANGISLDTSAQGLLALKSAGFSDKVINAALTAARKSASAPSVEPDKGIPDEIGIYFSDKGVLTPLPVELVGFKSAGILGSALTYGIKKGKVKGVVQGANSSAQIASLVTIILRCADGIAPTEYQLITLESKKDAREFTEAKIGLASVSSGSDQGPTQVKFEKISRNTYCGTIPQLHKGEYGFIAPAAGSSTKMYTFGLVE